MVGGVELLTLRFGGGQLDGRPLEQVAEPGEVVLVVAGGDHVRDVGLDAACGHDVVGGKVAPLLDERVGGVDRSPLGGVHRRGIRELDVLAHVARGQLALDAPPLLAVVVPAQLAADDQAAVAGCVLDLPDLAVHHDEPLAGDRVLEPVLVLPGLDEVAGAGERAVVQLDAALLDHAQVGEGLPHLGRQLRGLLVVVDDEHGALPGEVVTEEPVERTLRHRLPRAAEQPAVTVVLEQRRGVALADLQRRLALPLVREPAHLGEADGAHLVDEQLHGATDPDGAELVRVTCDQNLRARVPGDLDDLGERRPWRSSTPRR